MSESGDRLIEALCGLFSAELSVKQGAYYFDVNGRVLRLDENRLEEIVSEVAAHRRLDETSVVTSKSFEVLLKSDIPRSEVRFRLRRSAIEIDDNQHGISYSIGPASEVYTAFLLLNLPVGTSYKDLRISPVAPGRYLERMFSFEGRVEFEKASALEAASRYLQLFTLRMSTKTVTVQDKWQRYADSLLFHISYNLDLPLAQERYLEELMRTSRISRLRRTRFDEIDAPRRFYESDLVYHYQLGVAAESPMLEYLSFYHVAEHWFESIYQQDLVHRLQEQITSPNFSYKRSKDINRIIKTVTKAVQVRNEEMVISEQLALQLTLQRYVDLKALVADLDLFDDDLVAFYRANRVEFCDGDTVNLEDADLPAVYGALARRIYKTRNALVHSKDGVKAKFVPFSHEKQLIREVMLVRFVAEQIIIASSVMTG